MELIIAVITALGGVEALKWVAHLWLHRNTDKRKQVAEAAGMELEVYQKQITWLMEALRKTLEQVEQLHKDVSVEQLDKEQWIQRLHEVELALKEAEIRKCNKRGCTERLPPSDF